MAVVPNTTTTNQITTPVREIDFVSRFESNWDALREILGIMNPIRKTPGTKLVSSKASIVLQDGAVAEGDEVPLSQATVVPVAYKDITLKKYRKRVTAEAVDKYGAAVAIQKTDDALLNELQGEVLDEFYEFALTGELTSTEDTFQMAVAMAANITMQTQNGVEYLKNFLGAETMIVSSEIPAGTVLAIPADNIVLYYIDPADGDFQQLGLVYTTGNGVTNLIGVHKEGVYDHVSGDTHVIMGMVLWAEYLDAIAVVTFGAGE